MAQPPQGFQPGPHGFPPGGFPPGGYQPGFQQPPSPGLQMQVQGGFPPGPPPQPFPHPPGSSAGEVPHPHSFPQPGPPGPPPQPFPHPPPQQPPHHQQQPQHQQQQPQPQVTLTASFGTPGAPAVGLPSTEDIRAGFARIRANAGDSKVAASSSGLGHHSYSPTEVKSFTEFTNQALAGDPDLASILPINPDSEDLFTAAQSGVLLCKLLHSINPAAIDMRQVSLHPRNKFEALINHRAFLAAAKSLGFVIVNIGAEDLYSGEKNYLTHALFWQTIRYGLLSRVNITSHPEIAQLMRAGESTDEFAKLPAEENLLRWVNFHLARSSCPRRITNFGKDIIDSEVYIHLLNQIEPGLCTLEALAVPDPAARAEAMLQSADRLGCRKFVTPGDVVAGNEKLNLAFVATLFHEHPGIAPPSAEEEVQRVRAIEGAVRDRLQVEEEEFRRRLAEEQRRFQEAMEKEREAMHKQMEEALRGQEEERNKALEDQAKRLNSEWKKVEEEREKLEHERAKQAQHMQKDYAEATMGMSLASSPLPQPVPVAVPVAPVSPPVVGGYPTSGYPPPSMPSMMPSQMGPPMIPGQLPMPPMMPGQMPGQMPVGYGTPGYVGYPTMQPTMYSTWYPTYYQQVGTIPTVIHVFKK